MKLAYITRVGPRDTCSDVNLKLFAIIWTEVKIPLGAIENYEILQGKNGAIRTFLLQKVHENFISCLSSVSGFLVPCS